MDSGKCRVLYFHLLRLDLTAGQNVVAIRQRRDVRIGRKWDVQVGLRFGRIRRRSDRLPRRSRGRRRRHRQLRLHGLPDVVGGVVDDDDDGLARAVDLRR